MEKKKEEENKAIPSSLIHEFHCEIKEKIKDHS